MELVPIVTKLFKKGDKKFSQKSVSTTSSCDSCEIIHAPRRSARQRDGSARLCKAIAVKLTKLNCRDDGPYSTLKTRSNVSA
jgi:hypothetical protein